jgi:transcriptional regulator with XRE-family HTH domain
MRSLRRSFGLRLKSIRTSRKLTQEQFAEFIGVSVDFLSLIERGISAPSFERIEQIAGRLDTSVASLFTFPPPAQREGGGAGKRRAK